MTVFHNITKQDVLKLKPQEEQIKTIYEEARFTKDGVTLVLYTSGKLLLQGKQEAVEKVAAQLEKQGLNKADAAVFRKERGVIIGSDESLKGDTFGGLVVAAVKADDTLRKQLIELGVADSKTLSDKEILLMAEKIKHLAPSEVVSILPEEYNREGNVTALLNKYHLQCARDLSPGKHIVDKYPGCMVGDVQLEKAESKYVEVAAASVIARAAALQQLAYLSKLAGFTVPKGSTHVRLALIELKDRQKEFRQFVKVGFQNVREFL